MCAYQEVQIRAHSMARSSELLLNHSSRVYYFGTIAGKQRGLKFDPELLCAGAMACHGVQSLTRRAQSLDIIDAPSASRSREAGYWSVPCGRRLERRVLQHHREVLDHELQSYGVS